MRILVTIAARGGSKGIKDKNIRPLSGRPLIAISIQQALAWGKGADVIVTTDSETIAKVARGAGAQVPFLRPAELANDIAGKVPVLRHALIEMESKTGARYDAVLDLQPTSPVRSLSDLDGIVELFKKSRPKTILSAVLTQDNPYFNLLEEDEQGFVRVSKSLGKPLLRRQDAPAVYAANGSIYVYDRDVLADAQTHSVLTDRTLVYPMSDLSGVDIDREIDFKFLEFLVKEGLVSF
jgi:CMP-N,N'-diacetyllegionaminic acid synthase